MARRKKPKLIRVQLAGGPYDSDLFCPYCGTQILSVEDIDNVGECPHLIYSAMDDDPEPDDEDEGGDTEKPTFHANDLCFVYFEQAPASRDHFFVFRENAEQ